MTTNGGSMDRRPVTWTDAEIGDARLRSMMPDEKGVTTYANTYRRFLASIGAVHPAEVREREREAATVMRGNYPSGDWGDALFAGSLDRLYPSLLPKTPPPLVLSTGTFNRESDGWRQVTTGEGMLQPPWWNTPKIVTASDADKLAAWLREYGSEGEKR